MSDTQPTIQSGAASQDAASSAAPMVGGHIVVGVDGSPGALEALRFAMSEARLRGAELRAVSAWRYPDSYDERLRQPSDDELAAAAHDALVETITEAGGQAGVQVKPLVKDGHAAAVLLAAAADADLLVVGSRGRGGVTGLLLGSVSQKCVQHATCPVVVVPTPHPANDDSPDTTKRGR